MAKPFVRRIMIVAYTLIGGYVACSWRWRIFQRHLLYFPTKMTEEAAGHTATSLGFQPWRNSAGGFLGGSCRPAPRRLAPFSSPTATPAALWIAAIWPIRSKRRRRWMCIYWSTPDMAPALVLQARKALRRRQEEAFDNLPTNLPVYLVSESLGAGAVSHLARIHPERVAGMALFAPYHDMAAVAQDHFPFLLGGLILRDRFNPAADLQNYRGPIQFVLAGADEVIPNRFGRQLYESYAGPKTLQTIPGAGHNDIEEQSPEWWLQVMGFWRQHPPAAGNSAASRPSSEAAPNRQ